MGVKLGHRRLLQRKIVDLKEAFGKYSPVFELPRTIGESWADGNNFHAIDEEDENEESVTHDDDDLSNWPNSIEESGESRMDEKNRKEYKLTKLERQMIQHDLLMLIGLDGNLDSQSSSIYEGDSEIWKFPREEHHLLDEYMQRLGDADLCRQAHLDLVIDYENLLEAQEVRQKIGRDLLLEDWETLANFPAEEARILKELRQINANVRRLRLECI